MCENDDRKEIDAAELDVWRRNSDAISELVEVAETPRGVLEELKEPGARD